MSALPAELNNVMKIHASGNVEEAKKGYLQLLEKHPDNADLLHLAGLTYFQSGDMEEANKHLQEAASREPRNYRHTQKLVEIEKKAGNNKAAIDALDAFLDRNPEDTHALQELLNLGLNNKIFEPIFKHFERLIRKHPEDMTLRQLIILAYTEAEMFAEGAPHFEAVVKADPNQPTSILIGFGKALLHSARANDAIPYVAEWQKLYPNNAEMHMLQASNYTALAMPEKALAEYRIASKLKPDDAGYHMSAGLIEFLTTDMKEGYEEYFWRHKQASAKPFNFDLPRWQGESLAGKHLVLWSEQGLGDIIMFASLLPPLIKEAQKITLLVYPKIFHLMQQTFPDVEVLLSDLEMVDDPEMKFDLHAALGDIMPYMLPRYTPAEHPPFLKASQGLRDIFRTKYEMLAQERGAKRIIGISWYSTNKNTGPYRNIPLKAWAPVLSVPGIQFVSLQYSHHEEEIAATQKEVPGALHIDNSFDQYNDTASLVAQIAAMDEVITIQNATSHMAGALGIPTTLLLSAAADWRWGKERSDSIWYKSVKIERQETILNWKPMMKKLRKQLEERS